MAPDKTKKLKRGKADGTDATAADKDASEKERDHSKQYEKVLADFKKSNMFTPDDIRKLHQRVNPLVGERIKLAEVLEPGAKVVGDVTQLRDIFTGLDFSGVDLTQAYVGVLTNLVGYTMFVPEDPRFMFDKDTKFNDEKPEREGTGMTKMESAAVSAAKSLKKRQEAAGLQK